MALVRMSTRGRVTIPKELRDELKLKPGDGVTFTMTEGVLLLQPVRVNLKDDKGNTRRDAADKSDAQSGEVS